MTEPTSPSTTTPSVLFVCVHNAGRSQMAAGFLAALGAGKGIDAVHPIRDDIHARVLALHAELGVTPAPLAPVA